MSAKDGISVRFIRQYDIQADTQPYRADDFYPTAFQAALDVVLAHPREGVPLGKQIADALAFIKGQRQ